MAEAIEGMRRINKSRLTTAKHLLQQHIGDHQREQSNDRHHIVAPFAPRKETEYQEDHPQHNALLQVHWRFSRVMERA